MKRLPQLDGIRGIAILMVLVWHYGLMQTTVAPNGALWFCARALLLTWSGVNLFFVLSGFLIVGILLDQSCASNYFRIFYLRRACRILPLYLLLLAIFISCIATGISTYPRFRWLFSNSMPLWSYAAFVQNFFMGIRNDFGGNVLSVTWSLAVEEQFYLLIPLLIYVLPRRLVFVVLLGGVLAAPVFRYNLPGLLSLVSTPSCADALLSGACLAMLVRSARFLAVAREHQDKLLVGCFIFLAGAVVMTVAEASLVSGLAHIWLAGLYTLLILVTYLNVHPGLGRLLSQPVLVWFGRLSYGIYLFHEPVQGLFYGLLRGRDPNIIETSDIPITGLSLVVTLLLATLSYRYLESPILKLGHTFHYARSQTAHASASVGPDTCK